MVKPAFRTKSLGTKVTPEECARLEAQAAARGLTMSEWVREVLLEAAEPTLATAAEEAILAEVVALRTILLNVLFRLANGERIAAEEMRQLIERADGEKSRKAMERLLSVGEAEKAVAS